MAIYQGARLHGFVIAPTAVPRQEQTPVARSLPRRRVRPAARAERRLGRVRWLLATIVIAFALAFFSLAQTVRVSATSYEISSLVGAQDQLDSQRRSLLSDVNRLGSEPAIRKLALDDGLSQLRTPIVLPAR
ncbi:MAG TPA: hypothetical protein VIM30_09190 [Candidatus Limnocylindrales bacterium]|jgi:cell division protein FtsL